MEDEPKQGNRDEMDAERRKIKRKSLAAFLSGLLIIIASAVLILLLWP